MPSATRRRATASPPPRASLHSSPGPVVRSPELVVRLPPSSFFGASAIFHYLGPSLAVLLFAHLTPLGVMWLRIASAALIFTCWRRPWRTIANLDREQMWVLAALAVVLAGMNSLFYLAVDRLPLATVGAIEFLGTVLLATLGVRSWRNLAALAATICGVALLTALKVGSDPLGYLFAFGNCLGFVAYVVLGHRIANAQSLCGRGAVDRDGGGPSRASHVPEADTGGIGEGAGGDPAMCPQPHPTRQIPRTGSQSPSAGRELAAAAGIDQLGASMGLAALLAAPAGLPFALPALSHPLWLLWGFAVGLCSSVIPYVTDQLAMARLPRATFALMLALLPVCATVIGIVVLGQIPAADELAGIGLVIAGLIIHQPDDPDHPDDSDHPDERS